jgi:AcrR family transcriptional regulator
MPSHPARPYHHGDLRPALLRAAVEAIGHAGPAAMSLRQAARQAGVSHAAAAYHFGDKAGLLTAVAAQGYRMLTAELQGVRDARRGFLELGVAYVRFAVRHRAHFEVMYRPELYRPDDPQVRQARAAAAALLYGTASPDAGRLAAGAAAWSLVHGLATLWLNGNLPGELGDDPEEITRLLAPYLNIPETMTARPDDTLLACLRTSSTLGNASWQAIECMFY